MIIKSIRNIRSQPLFFHLLDFVSNGNCYLKLEGLNIANSIKLTTAVGLIESLENSGRINPETVFIESSSGNLGVALSLICKEKGYRFICVTDPNILPENEKMILMYGAKLIKVTQKDENGGYLATRIRLIKSMLVEDPNSIWLNQYANQNNPLSHHQTTASEIYREFPHVDYLFIGAGTTGTLMGCAKFFRENSPDTKIIAVDTVGSVTFGFPSSKRYIPGIGTSRRPELVDESFVDHILQIKETDTVKMCHQILDKYSLLIGGSTGTVLAGIKRFQDHLLPNSTIVSISPDFGYKYMDTVYCPDWVQSTFGNLQSTYPLISTQPTSGV